MTTHTRKILTVVFCGISFASSLSSWANAGPECSPKKLKEIRARFKAAVKESIRSCHRPKGPHTTSEFETKLAELKTSIKKRMGRKAGKIHQAEEDLWAQLGVWSNDTNKETTDLFELLFEDTQVNMKQYKSCGAKLYTLTSSTKDWSARESRSVMSAIKCIQKGSAGAYGKYFKSLDGFNSSAKKSDTPHKRKKYEQSRRQVLGFYRELEALSYLTRCTEQRQRRDQVIAELKACKENVVIDVQGNPQSDPQENLHDSSSVPDCVPNDSNPSSNNAQELQQTGEKLQGSSRPPTQD